MALSILSHSKFERIPNDVHEEIAVSLGCLSFLGPPTDIRNFLLVSKTFYVNISTRRVYARLFAERFDVAAPLRRLGTDCKNVGALAKEFVKRFQALRRLKANAYRNLDDPETFRLDLWTAYLMFLENDGKNAKQLVSYADVGTFVSNYISHGGLQEDTGWHWRVNGEKNALALSLLWFVDKHRIRNGTSGQSENVMKAIFSFFVVSFMYPSAIFPLTTFRIPAATPEIALAPTIDSCFRGSRLACTIPDHFGFTLTVIRPLISPPMYLSTAMRLETLFNDPDPLMKWYGRTGTGVGSKSHDADWARLRACHEPGSQPITREHTVFKPGTLHGKWVGRCIVLHQVERSLGIRPFAMQIHIREHHQTRKDGVLGYDDISRDGVGNGLFNAWLPRNTRMNVVGNDLLVYDPNTKQSSTYRTYDPDVAAGDDANENIISQEDSGLYGSNIHDILLTAQSEEIVNGPPENIEYEGRIRACDGLVILIGKGQDCIFFGQIDEGRHIIGRWLDATNPDVNNAGPSGVWYMTKVDG